MDDFIRQLFGDNQFLEGGLVIGALGLLVALARQLPRTIWNLILRLWSVSVVIRDQTLILWLGVWLEQSEYGKRNRWFEGRVYHTSDGMDAVLGPGYGAHTFWLNGTRVWLHYELEDQGVAGKKGVLAIRTLGRDDKTARSIIEEAVKLANLDQIDRVPIFINDEHGYWYRLNSAAKRFKNSVFLADGLMETILADAREFLENQDWYAERGIPHRRGYLLHGPPGNGKSTIVRVLAAELSLPIYALVLTDPEITDTGLAQALSRLPDKCILSIEDFEKLDLERIGVSMSGMLNAMDGPLATEGRVLILTANDIAPLLPSLLRPGRVDRRWLIDYPARDTVLEYASRFYAGVDGTEALVERATREAWSMAKLQGILLARLGQSPKGAGTFSQPEPAAGERPVHDFSTRG